MASDLRTIFDQFAAFGASSREATAGVDGRNFSKMCKDAGLFDKKFSATDADLLFAKVKGKGKKITYQQFEAALEVIAEKKGQAVTEVISKIVKAGGPKTTGATKAEHVKFYDDKSTFTGVHARGGPTNYDGNRDLSSLCDRSSADVRGVSKTYAKQH